MNKYIPGIFLVALFLIPPVIRGMESPAAQGSGADSLEHEDIYIRTFESAYADGKIDDSEQRLLNSLQTSLGLSNDQVAVLRDQVKAASPERLDQSGRLPLVLQNMVWGSGLYGWALPYVLNAEEPRWIIGSEVISLDTAFYLTYQYTKNMNIPHTRAPVDDGGLPVSGDQSIGGAQAPERGLRSKPPVLEALRVQPGRMGEQWAERMTSPKCGCEMKVIAVIQEPGEIDRILRLLVKQGYPPPQVFA